ncbi:superoxide dismutase family protein [Acinetobacter sp. ANC 5380]|uniref:Superoxide dismutase [Cu-Zn] n=1 Tax=Acinetobacter terrae TaxID=2731247 RepID=A0A7Y2WBN7_9GAMM|nr:superoxide dismutase family protein [Acinetobacter terrae]NNH78515.1 superoxide dismutase family protein [Acinetobacter terrae]
MLSSLFKLTMLCAIAGVAMVGCAHSPSSSSIPENQVTVHAVSAQGVGKAIGTIQFKDSPAGLVIVTHLSELPPGPHGLHIHEKGSCDPAEKDGKIGAAIAAGGHFNPTQAPHHGTPITGHLGDLPVLNVDAQGNAKVTLVAPRLKLANIQGLAVMVHAGGDNYSDQPKPLGGGGDRIACGLIQ